MASFADHLSPSEVDLTALLAHRYDPQYAPNSYKATRLLLTDCQANATQHRLAHLQERAQLASLHSNSTTETALNNILKAKAARATFAKLQKYAKGASPAPPSTVLKYPYLTLIKNLPMRQNPSQILLN